MTKKEFGQLVRRTQAGDAVAQRELRSLVDGSSRRTNRGAGIAAEIERRLKSAPAPQTRKAKSSRIDRAALRKVIGILGITRPVTIRWVKAEEIPGRTGEHEFTAKGEHVIRLRDGRAAADTNRTALHELGHAATADGYAS